MYYTRREAAKLCRRSKRTMFRWEADGRLTKLPDPSDPSGRRVRFAGPEVEALARRLRRLEEGKADDGERGQIPQEREPSRPKLPRATSATPAKITVAPRTDHEGVASRFARKPTELATTHGRTTRGPIESVPDAASPAKSAESTAETIVGDPELEAWAREIDDRKMKWEQAQANAADEGDEAAPSSARRR